MELRGFKSDDFAKYHPGGSLGKKLYLRVSDLVGPHERPAVNESASIRQVLLEITSKRLGATAVLNEQNEVKGIITDGDIRRMMEKYDDLAGLKASDIMGHSPKTISMDALAVEALEKMRESNINQLIAMNEDGYGGILHLQDLVREGII